MSGVVVFDWLSWAARYPELASIGQTAAQMFFNEACLYVDNTATSPVCDLGIRATFLNMVTAHIAALNGFVNGAAPSPLVGRISGATEGSVNVQVELNSPQNAAWFAQTKYGYAFWQASAQFRQAHYYVPPDRRTDPWGPYFGPN